MATDLSISLTNANGDNFSLDANKVIYAYNNSDSKAVLTYQTSKGVNAPPVTLTISTAALIALSTNILFSAAVIQPDGTATTMCFNKTNVIKLSDLTNAVVTSGCLMSYSVNVAPVPQPFFINDTPANVSTACKSTVLLTDNVSGLPYYLNGARVANIDPEKEAGIILESAVVVHPGTGQVTGDVLPLTGGTYTTQGKLAVASTKVSTTAGGGTDPALTAAGTGADPSLLLHIAGGTGTGATLSFHSTIVSETATPVAAGTGYVPGDTVNPNGGTGTKGVITITHTKVVGTVTVVGAGSGGTPGLTTFTGVSGTGTKFQITGTIGGGGTLSGALTLTVAGDYTVNPSTLTATAITGGSLTGATVSITMGALTTSLTSGGSYTVNPTAITASGTTAVTGTGAGMTVTFVMGVLTGTLAVVNAGDYTVNPTLTDNAVTTGATGATVTITMGVSTATVNTPGDYTATPTNPVLQGTSTGSGTLATFNAVFGAGAITGCRIFYNGDASASLSQYNVDQTKAQVATLINALS